MPRPVDASTLNPGRGRLAQKTVEDSALRTPNRDTDPLRAHLDDPSRAHMAESTGIADAGSFFFSDEVEGALQELGGSTSAARQNGWVAAGTSDFPTAVTVAGATLTLAGTWQAVVSGGLLDLGGASFTLSGPNGVYWVYLDPSTGALAQSLSAPDITGAEDVPVGRFTFSGVNITAQEDARYFVRNDSRKITYSVRGDATDVRDSNSEGSFATLEAAFAWLSAYSVGAGATSQKRRIFLRGEVSTPPLLVPVNGLEIVGEEGAQITLTGAGTLLDLDGKSGVLLQGITFTCGAAGSVAVGNGSGDCSNLVIDRCKFESGTQTWDFGISLGAGTGSNLRVENSIFAEVGTAAIDVEGTFSEVTLSGNQIDGYLGLGTEPTATGIRVASGFLSGETPRGVKILGNDVWRCANGISVEGRADARAYNDFSVNIPLSVLNGDTLLITDARGNVLTLTAASSSPGPDQFLIGLDAPTTALNIVNAVNDPSNSFFADAVRAENLGGGSVRLYAVPQGAVGNNFTLAAGVGTGFTIASPNFSNGFDGSIESAVVSENRVRNCVRSSAALPPFLSYGASGAKGIGLLFTRGALVSKNSVSETGILIDAVGAPLIPSLIGPFVESSGIAVWNSTRFQVEGNSLFNTTGTATGDQRGILVVCQDQGVETTFTNSVSDSSLTDNQIVWELEGNFAETPGASSGKYGIQVLSSILPAPSGSDALGAAYQIEGLRILGNAVSGCGGRGIQCFAGEVSQFSGLEVSDNSIGEVGTCGIELQIGPVVNLAGASGFGGVLVGANQITGVSSGPGILLTSTRDEALNSFSRVVLSGNQIDSAGEEGISFRCVRDAAYFPDVSGIEILDNLLSWVGLSGTPLTAAISFFGQPGDSLSPTTNLEGVRLERNTILDSGGSQAHAIDFYLENWNVREIEVSKNRVSGSGGSPAPGGGFRLDLRNSEATPANRGALGVRTLDNYFFLSGNLPAGTGSVLVAQNPSPGDTLTFYFDSVFGGTQVLTATAGAPGLDEFQVGGTTDATALNIVNAILDSNNSFLNFLSAQVDSTNPSLVRLSASANYPGSLSTPTGPVSSVPANLTVASFSATNTGVGALARASEAVLTIGYLVTPWTGTAPINDGNTLTILAPTGVSNEVYTFRTVPLNPEDIPLTGAPATQLAAIQTVLNNQSSFVTANLVPGSSSYALTLRMKAPWEGRIGNFFGLAKVLDDDRGLTFGTRDGRFSYGEDDSIHGVSIETDGASSGVQVRGNKLHFSDSNATENRRPAYLRFYRAQTPLNVHSPSFGAIEVPAGVLSANQLLPAPGSGFFDTFTINDGLNPALTFQYLTEGIPQGNTAWVPIRIEYGQEDAKVREITLATILVAVSRGRLNLHAFADPADSSTIQLVSLPEATGSGAITKAPLGSALTITNWSGGVPSLTGKDNDFEPCEEILVSENECYGGIGIRLEVLNGLVSSGVEISRNQVWRDGGSPFGVQAPYWNLDHYAGTSLNFRSSFASNAPSYEGRRLVEGLRVSENEYRDLGYGAVSLYKSETRNNASPSLSGMTVSKNQASGCGTSGKNSSLIEVVTAGTEEACSMFSLDIEGNLVQESSCYADQASVSSVSSFPACAVASHFLVTPLVGAFGVSVRNNQVRSGSAEATQDFFSLASAFTFRSGLISDRVGFSGNTVEGLLVQATCALQDPAIASHYFVGEPANGETFANWGVFLRELTFEGNQAVENGPLGGRRVANGGTRVLSGSFVLYQVGETNQGAVRGNSISLGQETVTGLSASLGGILVESADLTGGLPGVPNSVKALNFSDNQVLVVRNLVTFFTAGISLQAALDGVGISNNQLSAAGQSAGGILVGNGGVVFPTPVRGSCFAGNSIRGLTANVTTAINIGTGAAPSGLIETTFTGNSITNLASDATGWDDGFAFGLSPLYSVTVTGNVTKAANAASGGVNPWGPGLERGTCTGNLSMGSGITFWDIWAANGGAPLVRLFRVGATALND
jgi:hypothetical protein